MVEWSLSVIGHWRFIRRSFEPELEDPPVSDLLAPSIVQTEGAVEDPDPASQLLVDPDEFRGFVFFAVPSRSTEETAILRQ